MAFLDSLLPWLPRWNPFGDPDDLPDEAKRAAAWVDRLCFTIDQRTPQMLKARQYYDGLQELKFATKKWRDTFGEEFGMPAVDNWCGVVVDTVVERMCVQGFRFGDDPDADSDAWDRWQEDGLDLESKILHTDVVVTGYGYTLTWPDATTGKPTISIQDPLQTVVQMDPTNPRRRLAGLSTWMDLDGCRNARLFTPDLVWTMIRKPGDDGLGGWQDVTPIRNPLGVVPIVPFVNRPDIYHRGRSDLNDVYPLQDAVNKELADMLIASEFTSFKQRVLIGAEVPINPDTGEPDQSLVGGINRWLAIEDPAAKLQELSASDLSNYISAMSHLGTRIAATSRTPPHYLLGDMVNISGDALKAADAGLVARAVDKMTIDGDAWEETMRLKFLLLGDQKRGTEMSAEIIWADPEIVSESARVDALQKMGTLGVPQEALWEKWGASPQEIDRWRKMREEQSVAEGFSLGTAATNPEGGIGLVPEQRVDGQYDLSAPPPPKPGVPAAAAPAVTPAAPNGRRS